MINEKSLTRAQQRLMGQAYAVRKFLDSKGKKGKNPADIEDKYRESIVSMAKGMTKKQLEDFASTKHKGLPERIEEAFQIEVKNTIPEISPVLKPESNKPSKKCKMCKMQNLVDYREFIAGKNNIK